MNRRPAFTLMELLMYLGLSVVVLFLISKFMVDISANAARSRASLELQANARRVTTQLAQAVRTASSASATADTLTVTAAAVTTYYCRFQSAVISTNIAGCSTNPINFKAITPATVSATELSFLDSADAITLSLTLESAGQQKLKPQPHSVLTTLVPRRNLY